MTATYNTIQREARDDKCGLILEVTLRVRTDETALISDNQWYELDRLVGRNVKGALSHYILKVYDAQRRSRLKRAKVGA